MQAAHIRHKFEHTTLARNNNKNHEAMINSQEFYPYVVGVYRSISIRFDHIDVCRRTFCVHARTLADTHTLFIGALCDSDFYSVWLALYFVRHALTHTVVRPRRVSLLPNRWPLLLFFFYWSHLGLVSNYLLYHCMLSSARLEARKNTPNSLHDVRKRPALFRPPTVHFYESNNDCGQIWWSFCLVLAMHWNHNFFL